MEAKIERCCGARLNLLILAALRYLERGWTFDYLEESTSISVEVLRKFFHVFIKSCSNELYDKFVTSHLINRSDPATLHHFAMSVEVEYAQAGFPWLHWINARNAYRMRQGWLSSLARPSLVQIALHFPQVQSDV